MDAHQLLVRIPKSIFMTLALHVAANKIKKKGLQSYQSFIVQALKEKIERDKIK